MSSNAENSNATTENNSVTSAQKNSTWAIVDVIGDGNCFYRSLYNAALFNHDSRAFQRLLECFGMDSADYDDISGTDLDALAVHVEAEHELPAEKQFSDTIRAKVAEKIRGSLLDDMGNSATNTTLKVFAEAGALKEAVREFSGTFRKEFRKLSDIPTMSRKVFKEKFAKVFATDCAFVSELEINVMNFILEPCGLKVYALNPEDAARIDISPDIIPLFVYRAGEHYNFVVNWHVYMKYYTILDNFGSGELDMKADIELFLNAAEVQAHVIASDRIRSLKGSNNTSNNNSNNIAGGYRARRARSTQKRQQKRRAKPSNKSRRRK
jgi:hypothetical protein